MSTDQLAPDLAPKPLSAQEASALAARHNLHPMGVRPPLLEYLRDTWRCRGFLITLSRGRSTARNVDNYLGQAWSLINPALNILVYYFIFGLVLGTNRGIHNFIGFLSVGIVAFQTLSGIITRGSTSIVGNPGLVRALKFPRCVMPLSVVLTELFVSLPAFVVVLGVMLITGERPTWSWLLYPVGILVNLLMGAGFALMFARLVNHARDLANFISIFMRLVRYGSGVFFSVAYFASRAHFLKDNPWIGNILEYQPFSISLAVIRQSVMNETPPQLLTWVFALIWTIVVPTVGLIFFWRAEETYGRG